MAPLSRFHDEPFDASHAGADDFLSVQMLARQLKQEARLVVL